MLTLSNQLLKMHSRQDGFSMLEVLVSLLILLLGLLGIAGLLVHVQKAEVDSYQRRQGLILLQDMVDRLNANRYVASCYALTSSAGTPYLGTGYSSTPVCTAGTAEQYTRAIADLTEWSNALKGAAEKNASVDVGAMVGARGCISYDAAQQLYRVSVAWQGTTKTFAPPAGVNCASSLYGDETLRRVVTAVVKIANLKS